jgi:hypothetical protein
LSHTHLTLSPTLISDDDNELATDNALSTLGKILEHYPDLPDTAAIATMWVNALPLTADALEAQQQHALLVKLLEARDGRVLGQVIDTI